MQISFSDYYVAYFDVLGYREYFKKSPDEVLKFAQSIVNAIDTVLNRLQSISKSTLLFEIAQIKIEHKIFSDNVLLCMKVNDSKIETVRLLTFLQIIQEIQFTFATKHKILIRGGVGKGPLYIDQENLSGAALIEVTDAEKNTVYPRIVLCESLKNATPHLEENEKIWLYRLLHSYPEEAEPFLDYLTLINHYEIYPLLKENGESIITTLKDKYPYDSQSLQDSLKIDTQQQQHQYLKEHKDILCEKINSECNYNGIAISNQKAIIAKERVIKKNKWLLAYHNSRCAYHKCEDCLITAQISYDVNIMNDYLQDAR